MPKDIRTATIRTENKDIVAVLSVNGIQWMQVRYTGKLGVLSHSDIQEKLLSMGYEVENPLPSEG